MLNNKIVEEIDVEAMHKGAQQNKAMPLISFIVPAYNVANEIEECIKSIIKAFEKVDQNNYEIIVVNDGSTDNTLDKLEQFKNIFNIKIITKSNEGLSMARNDGINNSSGKYLSFIDSDDYVISETADILMSQLDKNFDVIVNDYYDDIKGVLSKANILKNINSLPNEKKTDFYIKNTPKSIVQHYVVKKDILVNNDLFFLKGVLHEDLDWGMRISDVMCKNKLVILYNDDNPWYCYRRQREGSIMSVERNWKNTFSVLTMAIDLYKKLDNKHLKKQTTISLYSQLKGYFNEKNPQDKVKEIEQIANKNKFVFKSYLPKYFPFYICLKMFGFKRTMELFKFFI